MSGRLRPGQRAKRILLQPTINRVPAERNFSPRAAFPVTAAIFWKISEGNSPMPAFQEAFSDEQRWDIVNYVRTLAPKETNNKATK